MSWATPKVDWVAGNSFNYVAANRIESNIKLLAGGNDNIAQSTELATAYALVKRDANGSAAFNGLSAASLNVSGTATLAALAGAAFGSNWIASIASALGTNWKEAFAASLGGNWKEAFAAALGANWKEAFAAALGSNWGTALADEAGAGILARLLTAIGTGWGTALAAAYTGPVAGAGEYLIPGCYYNAPSNVTSTSYVKVAEIKCPVTGTIRIRFSLSCSATGYGRIYKNGSAFGTERSVGNGSATFSEDLSVAQGDLIQLYARAVSAQNAVSAGGGFSLRSNGYGAMG